MSGICDTCKRESCHMRFDGCKTCDVYEGGESRYEKLFGTPERAAQTLYSKVDPICKGCGLWDECIKSPEVEQCLIIDYDALLEWLRGDA